METRSIEEKSIATSGRVQPLVQNGIQWFYGTDRANSLL
jgi:hypothetical protein